MTTPAADTTSPLWHLLRRVVHVEPREAKALLYSFAYFFAVLTAYYIIRPVRDEMSVMLGEASLRWVFLYVFLVMLAAVPVFGMIVQRFPRRLVVPVVYGIFVACLVAFWLAFQTLGQTRWLAQAFFIWVSVFNLFVVSLFWSLMADLWKSDQAKRLYGFVAAGGSAGALTGPFITQTLVKAIGPNTLLLISAGFLALALVFVFQLRTELAGREEENGAAAQRDHGIWAGAVQVWQSPYLFRIALWVMFANLILTYFYLEQARIVGVAIAERADRVVLFARMDFVISVLTILLQIVVTGRVLERIGVGIVAASMPAIALGGFIGLAIWPVLGMIVTIMVVERVIGFAFANPAMRVMWTVVEPEEKYKAQSFTDTVVYRGGDAASGWMFSWLKEIGVGAGGLAALTAPAAAIWLWVSLSLGRMQADKAAAKGGKAAS